MLVNTRATQTNSESDRHSIFLPAQRARAWYIGRESDPELSSDSDVFLIDQSVLASVVGDNLGENWPKIHVAAIRRSIKEDENAAVINCPLRLVPNKKRFPNSDWKRVDILTSDTEDN